MKIKQPSPFTFEAGPRAVLLLHGFTGHSADVRMLGRFLETKGYSSHAPIYRGHGTVPEELIKYRPADWWEDVQEAYQHLKDLGYKEIAVAGLSIGGVFGLKLASENPIKGVVPMCAPMYFDNENHLTDGFEQFAKQYKQLSQKDEAVMEEEISQLMKVSEPLFDDVGSFVQDVSKIVDLIFSPGLVVQAVNDQMINPKSANYIYEHLESDHKKLSWYENSGHFITVGPEKDQLHEEIYEFLESLDWEE
ncbi:MAG TPA: alpha/beta fold hydrolase [Pseudogracilibacillus sp.]|nr:alpha/beta fold hydrolase [Pseudogracilibacillus sp.]